MTKHALIATGLALLVAIAAPAQSGGARESFARALQLQAAGDFEGAIRAYRDVLEADPSNFGAHANLGASYAHRGEYADAIAEYKAALASAPAEAIPAIRLNEGLAYYKSGQLPEALAEFEAIRRLDPSQRNATLLAADCYLRMGDYARVINLLEPIEGSAPDDRATVYMLGMAYIRAGKPEKGQALIDRLMKAGESAETHYLLGSVAFMAKDYPAAVKEFAAAVQLDPALPSLYSYYGRALLFSGDPDAAAEAFRQQLTKDANDFDANLQFAEILRFRKDLTGAEPLYRKAVSLEPKSVAARYGLALCSLAAGDLAAARRALEQIVTEVPQFGDAHRSLAEVYSRMGRGGDAARELASAGKLQYQDADSGLPTGSEAPDFALLEPTGEARVRLSAFRGRKPALVVFGSYTCPKFRSQVDALNNLFDRYHGRAGFLLVYIREAHGDGSWQSTANQREGVALADAADLKQKRQYAAMCLRKLRIRYPAVVDGMDGATEKQWAAFPSRVYVIDRTGRIRFNSLLDQQRFDAAGLEAALESALQRSR